MYKFECFNKLLQIQNLSQLHIYLPTLYYINNIYEVNYLMFKLNIITSYIDFREFREIFWSVTTILSRDST